MISRKVLDMSATQDKSATLQKFTGASRNAIPGPVKFPVNRPDKLTGPVVNGSFEKRAPGPELIRLKNRRVRTQDLGIWTIDLKFIQTVPLLLWNSADRKHLDLMRKG